MVLRLVLLDLVLDVALSSLGSLGLPRGSLAPGHERFLSHLKLPADDDEEAHQRLTLQHYYLSAFALPPLKLKLKLDYVAPCGLAYKERQSS